MRAVICKQFGPAHLTVIEEFHYPNPPRVMRACVSRRRASTSPIPYGSGKISGEA